MPYQIIWSERGVEWIYSGVLTGEEIIQSNEAIYGDPRFDDLRYQIVDFTNVVKFEVSEQDMKRMAYYDRVAVRSNPRIRLAVIAPEAVGRSIAETYNQHNKESGWEQRIFETRAEAEAWLGTRR